MKHNSAALAGKKNIVAAKISISTYQKKKKKADRRRVGQYQRNAYQQQYRARSIAIPLLCHALLALGAYLSAVRALAASLLYGISALPRLPLPRAALRASRACASQTSPARACFARFRLRAMDDFG